MIRVRAAAAPLSLGTLLDRERAALDALIGDVELGVRDQQHFNVLEERASGICNRTRAAFREVRR